METDNVTFKFKRSVGFQWPSERAIADATVAFLNGARICVDGQESSETTQALSRSEGWIEVLEALLESIKRKSECFSNSALLESEGARSSVSAGADEMRCRAVLRGLFCAFAQKPEVTREHFIEHEITWNLKGDTYFRATGIFHAYQLNNYQNVVSVGSALLLDPKEGLGQKLCQCHLLTCKKFFWEIPVPRGRPKRRYCSPEHLNESHSLNAGNRTKISRERKKRRVEEAERLGKIRRKR